MFTSKPKLAPPTPYKELKTFDERSAEATKMLTKYPDRLPIILEKETTIVPDITERKFLVPKDITVGQFLHVIRKRMVLPSDKAVFLMFSDNMLPVSSIMSNVYNSHKDADNFLYCSIKSESVFG